MRIKKMKFSYFRGFTENQEVSFDSPLVIFYGPNGSGKTAIAEAIEWLFYGETRRRKVINVDEVEHRGAFKNVLCPEGGNTYVEAEVISSDGSIKNIRRELLNDGANEFSKLYIDEKESEDFTSLGLIDIGNFYPIIVQDNIQELIITTGASRRNYISRLLGLESLIEFDKVVDSACEKFKRVLPDDISNSISEFGNLEGKINRKGILSNLVTRWNNDDISLQRDCKEILKYCQDELEMSGASNSDIINQAARLSEESKKAIFDVTPFKPVENITELIPEFNRYSENFKRKYNVVKEKIVEYAKIKSRLFAELAFSFSGDKIKFWENGIELLGVTEEQIINILECPFCEERTITREKFTSIKERISQTEEYNNIRKEIGDALIKCKEFLENMINTAKGFKPKEPDDDSKSKILQLLPNDSEFVDRFIENLNILLTSFDILQDKSNEAISLFGRVLEIVEKPEEAEMLPKLIDDNVTQIDTKSRELLSNVDNYKKYFEEFYSILHPILSSDEKVRNFEFIKYLANSFHTIFIACEVFKIHKKLKETRQKVRDYLSNEDIRRVEKRGGEIKKWFDLLYGSEEDIISFDNVESIRSVMRIFAKILSHRRHASTHLSQSQLNCLGIAMHIVAATNADCPFDFIVFDDPLQSFDDEIREKFIGTAVNRILDEHGKQVIILTHLKNIADRLRYGNERRGPLFYKFDEFSNNGIQVRPFNRLSSLSKYIRQLARGDDNERDTACQRLRSFVEHAIKAIYQVSTGEVIPIKYEGKTGYGLLVLIESLHGFSPTDLDFIRESFSFGMKPSHDDAEWSPPPTPVIAHRMDRLEQICKNNGLSFE